MIMSSRKSLVFVGMLFVLSTFACGEETDSSSKTYGPAGPTQNGYILELTVSPSVLQNNGTAYLSVYVTNSSGVAVPSVTAYFSGSSDTLGSASTSASGYAGVSYTVESTAGDIVYVTVTVEDISITAPIQII